MQNTIAQVLGCQADEVAMKPIGFCQVKGESLFMVADLEGKGTDIIRDHLKCEGYDIETAKHDNEVLKSARLIPFTYGNRKCVLLDLPMKHLDGFEPHER